jgi:hypothetical protein
MEVGYHTSIISTNETLVGGSIKGERSAHKLFKVGALDFTSHFIFNIVDNSVEISGISIVSSLVGTIQITRGILWLNTLHIRVCKISKILSNREH